ncbi:hypothetical protein T02_9217 [Trichinella nativa]|uniref:Uncharacterized protein n=1 Tax=Trichinella nativa TaxID=6335 RepID=A0A0V1LMQ6_9BILA|nr:hypothetical protein T02_9217 [Trichinella nativa]
MRGTLVTENEEECFRLNSSPYAGGEQQGVEGEDGNANQQADYKRSRYKQQQRRRPRPQVEGGAASVANLLALCSASLDGQRTKLSLYGQCLLPISVVNRVVIILLRVEQQSLMRIKKENPTIQYPMIILLIGLDVTSNDQRMQFAIYEMIILTEYLPNLLGFFWYFLKSCQDEHVDNYGENADRGCYERLF